MSSALERQIKPIYDALDSGSNKSALVAANKFLKKTPKNALVQSLKALALVRLQKVEESLVICDEVLATKPSDDGTLTAMMHVLRALGRNIDTIKMFDDAYKQRPTNEELGIQTFFANVRVNNWKAAQQVATKLQKQFQEDRYVFWNAMSSVLQARDPSTPAAMKPVLFKLAHRLLTNLSPRALQASVDRGYLYLDVVSELELWDEADAFLNSELGQLFCSNSLHCDELRRKTQQTRGLWKQEGDLAKQRIQEKKDRNWLEFLSVLDATFAPLKDSADTTPESERKEKTVTAMESAQALFKEVAERDGSTDRSGLLAQLELEKRSRAYGISEDPAIMLKLVKEYIQQVGSKACCYEDLKPYLSLSGEELTEWLSFLDLLSTTVDSSQTLQRHINIKKFQRYHLTESQITAEQESKRALEYATLYIDGLKYGTDLPDTETQPADDLAILAAHAYVNVHKIDGKLEPLHNAASLLEFGLTKSKSAFQLRLILIRIYHLLCAPSAALEHYRALNIKQVQNDTLSHLLLSRSSAFSLGAIGDLTLMTEVIEASQIYISNTQDTPEGLTRAFLHERYTQIPDFLVFYDRLEHSLQRDLARLELMRMRMPHEVISADFIDVELIELKFNLDRVHHDNRDFGILPNYQPQWQATFFSQTELFHESQGLGWLWVYLKIYIRALQQSSDLDEVVEEKLLVGDRPKLQDHPDNHKPLNERLVERPAEERKELSNAEATFYDYCTELANWLGPHHDHIRPPASQVLAKASQLTELKTGHPLKGYDPTANGALNGSSKKEGEAPPVLDAPALTFEFFDRMHTSLTEAQERNDPLQALHVATITQEALCILSVQSLRFKPPSTVKMHKLGNLVQSIKDIRSTALEVLKIMSADLVTWGGREAGQEKRKSFVDATDALQKATSIDHEFVLNIAKKVTDARKKVLEGVGQGLVKMSKNHA